MTSFENTPDARSSAAAGRLRRSVSDLTQGGTDLAGCVYNISTDRSKGGYGNYSISSRRYGYGYGYGKHYGYGYGYGSHSGSHGKNSK